MLHCKLILENLEFYQSMKRKHKWYEFHPPKDKEFILVYFFKIFSLFLI
jgi:hypothetical protein